MTAIEIFVTRVVRHSLETSLPDEDLVEPRRTTKPFREQIELDSMDFLDIVMELRKRYRIQIPEDDYMTASLATLWPAR